MQRAFLPNVLASLGLVLILLATILTLFEWDIEMKADFSPTYEVYLESSPWITKLGESLEDTSYIKKVRVLVDDAICTNDEEFMTMLRSPNEKSLESISVKLDKYTPSLIGWSFITVILSGIYIWWFTVWQDRPISSVIAPMLLSVIFFSLLIGVLRLVDPKLSVQYLMVPEPCQGSLTLDVKLAKIHYEMLMVMFLGILGELIALGIMLRQFIMAIIQGKVSSKSAVG